MVRYNLKKIVLTLFIMFITIFGGAQTVMILFTGRDASNKYCKLDKVIITNLSNGWQETIYWPDTVLTMQNQAKMSSSSTNIFTFGNTMEYVGYATINGKIVESKRITQAQGASQKIKLQFNETENVKDIGRRDGQPCHGMPTVTDVDGNIYHTVQIGSWCWMKENLRTTRYANGNKIPQGSEPSTTKAYWYYPDNNPANKETYGLLYNWKAIMGDYLTSHAIPSGVQGICPDGWHIMSIQEFNDFKRHIDKKHECAGKHAKAFASTYGWKEHDGAVTYGYPEKGCTPGYDQVTNNSTGFGALPAGYFFKSYSYGRSGECYDFGECAGYWTVSEQFRDTIHTCWLYYYRTGIIILHYEKSYGLSVRCVHD